MTDAPAFSVDDCVMLDARVLGPDRHVFLAHSEDALAHGAHRCLLVAFDAGRWHRLASWPWQAVALEVLHDSPCGADGPRFEVLGRDGQVGSLAGGVASEALLEPGRPVGPLRGLRVLRGTLFAFGMKREVFWRDPQWAWHRITDGFEPPQDRSLSFAERMRARIGKVGGINALAIDARGHLTAFGMRGEIWRFDADHWTPIDSPTNLMLLDATEATDGTLFVCGQAGTVLEGDGDHWRQLRYEGPQALDFCAVRWFAGALYLADGHSLRRLDDGELVVVDHGVADIVPCARLAAGHGRMLCIAGQEVWCTDDGRRWTPLLG